MTRSTVVVAFRTLTIVVAVGSAFLGMLGVLGVVAGLVTWATPDEDWGPFIAVIAGMVFLAGAAVIGGITGLAWSTLAGASDVGAVPALPRGLASALIVVSVVTVAVLVVGPVVDGRLGEWGYLVLNAVTAILTLLLAGAAALSRHWGRAVACAVIVFATSLWVIGLFVLA